MDYKPDWPRIVLALVPGTLFVLCTALAALALDAPLVLLVLAAGCAFAWLASAVRVAWFPAVGLFAASWFLLLALHWSVY